MALFDRRFRDYRFAEEINEKGKRTVVLDYIGNYFYYKDKDRAMKSKPFHVTYAVIMIVCWFLALSIRIDAIWLAYISIPYVASIFGVIMYCRGVWVVMTKKEPFIRTQADSLTFKLMVGSGACVLLVTISLVGTLVATFMGILWWSANNFIFLGICLLYLLSALMGFKMRKDVDVVEKFRESEAPKRQEFTEEEQKRLEEIERRREEDKNKIKEVQQKKLDDEKEIKEEIQEINTAVDADYKEVEEENAK